MSDISPEDATKFSKKLTISDLFYSDSRIN